MCYVFLTINWSEAVKGTKCSSPLEKKKTLLWETFTLLVFMFYSSAMKISITLY